MKLALVRIIILVSIFFMASCGKEVATDQEIDAIDLLRVDQNLDIVSRNNLVNEKNISSR